jgi:4-carboxymuconolactone decarboxylase
VLAQSPVLVRAQTPTSAQTPSASTDNSPEARGRHAMATLWPGDRIKRPASWDDLTPDQKAFVLSILGGQRRSIDGSLGILLPSPQMGDIAQKAIAYARFNSSNPPKLNELAIIIAARAWTAQVAWFAHKNSALKNGISPEIVESIRVGKRPTNMPPDVEAVYNFCTELLYTRHMSDATFLATKSALGGDKGVVDLTATLAFYQLASMLMDVDNMPLPANAKPDLMPLDNQRPQ